ncbi:GDSL esterase/lipase At5g03610-like [Populus trichocarpa]|uniref:GDSL esterase/lipase At5g03610-like n=1 Tax=Populus trichocarpa TaxID=3694 RepID=UPI002278FAF4|nr:GDSL esterase/lipase At5g03610-like [Populus trichocarpa]
MLGFTSLHNIAYQNYQLSASLKRIAVTTLWPLGCLPILTAFSSYQNYSETWNIASKFHNQKLQQAIRRMNSESRVYTYETLNLYTAFMSKLNNAHPARNLKIRTLLIPCCVGVTSNYSYGNFDKNGAKKYVVCEKPENDWHESSCIWNPHFANSIRNIQRKKLYEEEEN